MTKEEQYREVLRRHLNDDAVDWVYNYFTRNDIFFHITRKRSTKLGDYRWPQKDRKYHQISVNGDLNPYMFLWVFMHEAAHFETYQRYSTRVMPHGHEWQAEFANLLRKNVDLFPPEVRDSIIHYTSRVPLYRATGRHIEELLRRQDKGYSSDAVLHLDNLTAGSLFRLKNRPEMLFRAIERRRTRWLCTEVNSGRQYVVQGTSEVIPCP